VALGWLVAPSSSASFWGGGFVGLGRFGADAVVGTDNQSLLAAMLRVLGRPELPLAAQAALAVIGVGLGALAARRALDRGGEAARTEAMVWIAFGGLLGSPVSWTHHWVWVLLAMAVFAGRRQPVRAALLLFAFWFPTVWIFYTENDFEELTFPWWKSLATAVYVVVGLGVLLREAARQPRSTAPTQATESSSPPRTTVKQGPSST
jgi:alpha-1,2-mannosyltransferase